MGKYKLSSIYIDKDLQPIGINVASITTHNGKTIETKLVGRIGIESILWWKHYNGTISGITASVSNGRVELTNKWASKDHTIKADFWSGETEYLLENTRIIVNEALYYMGKLKGFNAQVYMSAADGTEMLYKPIDMSTGMYRYLTSILTKGEMDTERMERMATQVLHRDIDSCKSLHKLRYVFIGKPFND